MTRTWWPTPLTLALPRQNEKLKPEEVELTFRRQVHINNFKIVHQQTLKLHVALC